MTGPEPTDRERAVLADLRQLPGRAATLFDHVHFVLSEFAVERPLRDSIDESFAELMADVGAMRDAPGLPERSQAVLNELESELRGRLAIALYLLSQLETITTDFDAEVSEAIESMEYALYGEQGPPESEATA